MGLKNILIVVKNVKKSAEFYTQIFDLGIIREFEGKIILTGGLVLQDKAIWEAYIQNEAILYNHAAVLYFEVYQLESFVQKLKTNYSDIQYLDDLTILPNGQKFLRFYDLDGNVVEVGEMIN